MEEHQQKDLLYVVHALLDEWKWQAQTLMISLATNAKVAKLLKQETHARIAPLVSTKMKMKKEYANRVNLVPGVMPLVVRRHPIARNVKKAPIQPQKELLLIQHAMLVHLGNTVSKLVL